MGTTIQRRRPPLRALGVLAAVVWAAVWAAPPAPARQEAPTAGRRPAVDCPPAERVEPAPGDSLFRWRAEPGLAGVALRLSESAGVRTPLPGLGDPATVLRGRPTVWLLEDLACLAAHGLGSARPDWVGGVAGWPDSPAERVDVGAGEAGRPPAEGDREPAGAPRGGPSEAEPGFVALRADLSEADLDELRSVLRHELAHLALAAATRDGAPRWLQEGYAQYAAGEWDAGTAWRLRLALLRRGSDVLRELSLGFPPDAEGARVAYLLSYTAVHELAGLAGPAGLRALFERLAAGDDVDHALRSVFGITEDQFVERWRERVRDRYGVLYVLSRATLFWVLVAILVAWAGWRRRKRDREKMERLREEERREEEWIRELRERWPSP